MKIMLSDQRTDRSPPVDIDGLFNELADSLGVSAKFDAICEVTFLDDSAMQHLNKTYRNVDAVTNVLAFPQVSWDGPCDLAELASMPRDEDAPPLLLGDVLVAPAQVLREAQAAGIPFRHRMFHIVVHGILHLFGYDHETDADERIMVAQERKFLEKCGYLEEKD